MWIGPIEIWLICIQNGSVQAANLHQKSKGIDFTDCGISGIFPDNFSVVNDTNNGTNLLSAPEFWVGANALHIICFRHFLRHFQKKGAHETGLKYLIQDMI